MGWLDPLGVVDMAKGFFSPEDNWKAAQGPVKKAWQQAQDYQRPFWQNGIDQYGRLNDAENSLLDPGALESKWASGYETSPYAQQLLKQNNANGLDAASSMGLMGSSAAINNIQQGAGQIVNADRQQYMNDLMEKYLSGIGIGGNIYGTGAQTGANLGKEAIGYGNTMGGLKYGESAAPGDLFGRLAGMGIGALTGGIFGGKDGGAFNGASAGGYGGYTG